MNDVRAHFPALARAIAGHTVAYFDGPGGTQVPRAVADAVTDYLLHRNANDGWAYRTSVETDATIRGARERAAAFVNAASTAEIFFGANMTTLTFHIARAFGRTLRPGDEIVVTELDHHANVDPWVALARDYGAVIKRVPLRDGRPELDLDAFDTLLGSRTRLVAVGASSNAFGTINPVAAMAERAHAAGALVFVDAVHAAAHAPPDVRALGADLLVWSAYKVYGPHVGVAYGRDDVLERFDFPRLAPQSSVGSKRGESGTLDHEGIAGTAAALDFLASFALDPTATMRDRLVDAMRTFHASEDRAFARLTAGLRSLPAVVTYEPPDGVPREPTVSFSVRDVAAETVSRRLSEDFGVFVSHGDFYATTATRRVAPVASARGGVVRAGIAIYTTDDDVDRLLQALATL